MIHMIHVTAPGDTSTRSIHMPRVILAFQP